jgi:hypothetical protein
MMRIELQWCQVQAGTAKHLLGKPQDLIDSSGPSIMRSSHNIGH